MNKSELRQLMQAAMCGDVEAQTYLGYLYYEGEGVEQNYNEAVKWYKKAAKQDYAPAQLALGECYYFGECVEQDYKKAVYWYEKGLKQEKHLVAEYGEETEKTCSFQLKVI